MLEQVESKISELRQKQVEEYYKKKEEDLLDWGLTYKKDGKKVTPIVVTDEEYEALIQASNGVGASGRNSYAKALRLLAFLVIGVGFAAGVVAMIVAQELGIVYFSLAAIVGLILGAIFFGLSEAIRLLQQLVDFKPNEKPVYTEKKETKTQPKAQAKAKPEIKTTKAPQQAPQQAPVYQQPPVYQQVPIYTPQGQPIYSQQPPIYVYTTQQPIQTQPAEMGTDIHYGK